MDSVERQRESGAGMHAWLARIACLSALLLCATVAHAQTPLHIYHCIGAQGEPVFSGEPCGPPAPKPGQPAAAPAGQEPAGVCAATPQALRTAVARAFAGHDANRFAGLLLWAGMGRHSADAALRSLSAWLQQPLAGIAIAQAAGPPPAAPGPVSIAAPNNATASTAAQPPTGFQISTGGGTGSTRDFGLAESGGCWWLTF